MSMSTIFRQVPHRRTTAVTEFVALNFLRVWLATSMQLLLSQRRLSRL